MMALSRNLNLALLLLGSAAVLVAVAPSAEAVIDFNSLMVTFQTCAGYLQGRQHEVPANCCTNLKSLVGLAHGSADWQTLCFFIEPLTHYADGQYTSLLAALPDKCGVDFHFKIDSSTDCSKIV